MSDRFPAEISIGGQIPEALVEDLVDAIFSEGVSWDWGDAYVKKDEVRAALQEGKIVTFVNDEASYGEFTDLEKFCADNFVDFDRQSTAKYEYDGISIYCRDGDIIEYFSTQNGKCLVEAKKIENFIKFFQKTSKKGLWEASEILKKLRQIVPIVTELTPVQIVETQPDPE